MSFILGQKVKMTQIFKENGDVAPVTLIEAGPCVAVQIKTRDKDGYDAVQLGFGKKKLKNIKKPQIGHLKGLGNFRFLKEFRLDRGTGAEQNPEGVASRPYGASAELRGKIQIGNILDISQFKEGEKVKISGINKGKGFQGVVKRHGFHGGPKSHGQKHSLRAPGSIGSTTPQHVIKGKRMPGRMGGERITVKNLEIVKIDKENNILAVKGGVPGRRGTLLEIQN